MSDATCIYVIEDGRGHVRIGMTDDIAGQLAALRAASAHPFVLKFLVAPRCSSFAAGQIEQSARVIMSERLLPDEWFAVPVHAAVAAIASAAYQAGVHCREIDIRDFDSIPAAPQNIRSAPAQRRKLIGKKSCLVAAVLSFAGSVISNQKNHGFQDFGSYVAFLVLWGIECFSY